MDEWASPLAAEIEHYLHQREVLVTAIEVLRENGADIMDLISRYVDYPEGQIEVANAIDALVDELEMAHDLAPYMKP